MSESEVKPSSGCIKSDREKYEPKSRDEVEKEMGGIGFDQAREEKKKAEEADQESVLFSCVRCGLNEMCHYLGRQPPSHKKKLNFKEDTFVMRDPFTPRATLPGQSFNKSPWSGANILVIGGTCSICGRVVCVDCSTFYTRRYCLDCASNHIREFPADIGAKIQKKLESIS